MLVDHHCHLDFPDFAPDLDGVVGRANAAGVGMLVTISTRVRRFVETLRIAETYPQVFCSVGTHPHYAHEELDIAVEEIVRLSRNPNVVACRAVRHDHGRIECLDAVFRPVEIGHGHPVARP